MTARVDFDDAAIPEPNTGCVLWLGAVNGKAYGLYSPGGGAKRVLAHRFSWERANGPIPEGMVLDHLCRQTCCVNPRHLEPVSPRVNIIRGVGVSAVNAKKNTCPRGHTYDWVDSEGRRRCKTCMRASSSRAAARRPRRLSPEEQVAEYRRQLRAFGAQGERADAEVQARIARGESSATLRAVRP